MSTIAEQPRTATPKKEYSIYDVKTIKSLERIYEKFFSKNNCQSLLTILNRFSIADAILNSGGTSIILEYKNRTPLNIWTYDTSFLECEKYNNLKQSSTLFNAPAFYIVEYSDSICVFQLDFQKELQIHYVDLPVRNKSNEIIKKPIYELPVVDADIIIGKRTWQRASRNQLTYYIEKMRSGND